MNLPSLAAKNVLRNKTRTVLTILAVAVSVTAFVALRTVLTAWSAAADYATKDRIATRHKVSFVMSLPKRYINTIRATKGVTSATWANWFGGKHPTNDQEFFASFAADPGTWFEVYDDMSVPKEHLDAWKADRTGAIVGDVLAKKFGWKVGGTATLRGTIYPGEWKFNVRGIYKATRKSIDRSSFIFHWDFLNESLPKTGRDQIGWVVSRIDDPSQSAAISKAVDTVFDDRDIQTATMSERDMNTSFMGMLSAVLGALDVVSLVILAIMALIVGNTIAMGVRERTFEYGVLRAIGFRPKHIALFILGESVTIGLIGGVVGVVLAVALVNNGLGPALEENMGSWFPYFRAETSTLIAGLGMALVLGVVAAAVPAYRASRLEVVDSLRRVG